MRLTVGPLDPAVYWRRRAVVLGGVLVAVLLLTYTCSGESGAKDSKNRATPNTRSSAQAASPSPSASLLTPIVGGGPGSAGPSANPPAANPPAAGNNPPSAGGAGAGGNSPCADSEVTVVPSVEAPSARQGVPTKFTIKIKNVSARTCARDVGAQMQELYLQQGTAKVWSSDACSNRPGESLMTTFPPSHEVAYWVTWDGKSTGQGCDNRPWLAKGNYQLYGRLGTKISEPVAFAVTG
jgi:hypothetical protein